MNYCVCEHAGFCEKHNCEKTQRDFELCKGIRVTEKNRDAYRRAWEEGRGYAQKASVVPLRVPNISVEAPPPHVCECSLAEAGHCELHNMFKSKREKEICRGDNVDKTEREELLGKWEAKTVRKINQNREPVVSKAGNISPLGGAGTELIAIFTKKGVPSCKACKDMARKMDKMGINRCEESIDGLAEEMLPRARGWIAINRSWVHRVLPDVVEDVGIKFKLKSYLKEAIANARTKEKKVDFEKAKKYRGPRSLMTASPDPYEFPGTPHKTLLFHLYPVPGATEHHFEKLSAISGDFDRKIMGIAYDRTTASPDQVKEKFGDDWEYVVVKNDKDLREVVTYRKMLKMLDFNDPNHVTFCAHGKGTQEHTVDSDPILWWTDAMYETVLYNQEGVIKEFEKGFKVVGSFRRLGNGLRTKYRWHYSGTFYAFKNDKFKDKEIPTHNSRWWGTESWPGDHFGVNESSVIFDDGTGNGDLYKVNLQPREEFEAWMTEHGKNNNG